MFTKCCFMFISDNVDCESTLNNKPGIFVSLNTCMTLVVIAFKRVVLAFIIDFPFTFLGTSATYMFTLLVAICGKKSCVEDIVLMQIFRRKSHS